MNTSSRRAAIAALSAAAGVFMIAGIVDAEDVKRASSYMPVAIQESFSAFVSRFQTQKPTVMARQATLLADRYDLANRPASGVTMTEGKAIQEGVRVKPVAGTTFDSLGEMTAEEIKSKDVFPRGFLPLPHAFHSEGGMVFPQVHIDEINKQEGRDLTRFDVDFDIPQHFLPQFPPAIYLTDHPELGDVSKGKAITIENYYDTFNGILNPKQLDGLRLLVTPFPQQQFNLTEDRKSLKPSRGVSCFDCHTNGHANGAFHLAQDARPQENRHRIETPSLRGVNIQRLFGSQRALKTIEDFTEFEQRGAYFDGDTVIAVKKGVNVLDRGTQVHAMAEFEELLNFPPAPKLDVFGKLDAKKASAEELRGEKVFMGKGQCAVCHSGEYFTDNLMHDLKTERFYTARNINGIAAVGDGPIKTFPLRGIKDSPPYLHDGRLLTLDDTVEFFNLVTGVKLTSDEKKDLVAYLKTL